MGSKTRREADPWWEVDLGMSYHLHSVSITIKGAVQQALEVNIMLFDGPIGFENPFLDSMKEVSVAMHTVILPANPRPKMEVIEWEMPGNAVGGALRVQLRGFHTLHLYRFQAYQGDHIHADNLQKDDENTFMKSQLSLEIGEGGFDTLMAAEDKRRFNSYASYHPDTFKNTKAYKERMNRSFTQSSVKSKRKNASMKSKVDASVADLTSKLRGRQLHVNDWIDRAKEASLYFTTEELVVARDMIFNSAMASAADDEKKRRAEEFQGKGAIIRRQATTTIGTTRSEFGNVVRAQDMYGAALVDLYPRVPLEAVTKALRGCASQVQGRDQRGEIGLMQRSPRFLFLCSDDTYLIDRYEKIALALKDASLRRSASYSPTLFHQSSTSNASPSTNPTDMKFKQEMSWSQFVIVLYCLSIGMPDHMLPLAFNRFDIHVAEDETPKKKKLNAQQEMELLNPPTHRTNETDDDFFLTAGTNDDMFDSMTRTRPMTPANESPPKRSSKLSKALLAPTMRRPVTSSHSMVSTAPGVLGGIHNRSVDSHFLESSRDRNKNAPISLKEKTKDEAIERLNLNFGHAQYKLGRIQTRVNVDIAPRKLRTKLTDVKFSEIPGGLDTLQLGISYPEELFEIGAGLSATGQPVEYEYDDYYDGTAALSPLSTASVAKQNGKTTGANDESGGPKSLESDNDSIADDISEVSLNQMLKLKRSVTNKPRTLTTQDSFVLKTNLKPRRAAPVMAPISDERPATTSKLTKSLSVTSLPSTQKNDVKLKPKRIPKPVCKSPVKAKPLSFDSDSDDGDNATLKSRMSSSKMKAGSFKKSCALCMVKFPLPSLENKALLKHVVDLRRIWNPKLVTKFAGHLADGMSLYNLVPVCRLCNQYFDPEFESGISPPSQCKADDTVSTGDEAKSVLKPRKEPIAFYDDRFSGIKKAGYILREEETIVLRSRAKRANEISEELKKESPIKQS
jgi:hypothetical protein